MATQPSGIDGLPLSIAVLIGAVLVSGSIIYASYRIAPDSAAGAGLIARQAQPQAQLQAPVPGQQGPRAVDASKVTVDNDPILGSVSAPVSIYYWFDYQCPVCRAFEEQQVSQLKKDYIDTGKIRIVYKDMQFLGEDSISLGLVSRAVWELAPDKFYAWHKAVYDNQGQERTGWATQEKIAEIATAALGADFADRAIALAASHASAYKKEMAADRAEAKAIGIDATPSFVIGDKLIVGLYPYNILRSTIDAALNKK